MEDEIPERIRLKDPERRVRSREFAAVNGARYRVVLVAHDLDFNGPQEPYRRNAPRRREFHEVEFFHCNPGDEERPDYTAPYGCLASLPSDLASVLDYDFEDEGPFVLWEHLYCPDPDDTGPMSETIDRGTMTKIIAWLQSQVAARDRIARIEPTPQQLERARRVLAEYGFEMVTNRRAGWPYYQIECPASSIPLVSGYRNAMNIEDVERFAANYAPRRREWHRIYPVDAPTALTGSRVGDI